jgi:molybdate transport system ATP-binding protein
VLDVDVSVKRGAFGLDVRFRAPAPGVTALFGASGAGKSTLVEAIAGLARPERGAIALGDRAWFDAARGLNVPAERRRIGCVFQDARLFPHLDVAGNLDYAARRAPSDGRVATREELIALLGLGPLLRRRVHRLSGGERQRVALARALLSQPVLLLLDEPLASIDVARREEVLPYLETLRDRYAIPMLYVSHQYDEVLRLAGYVVLLAHGAVACAGTPAALASDPHLARVIGAEAVGAVLEATVAGSDPHTGLTSLAVGRATLRLALPQAAAGSHVRLSVLARDVILATNSPLGLSVRNALPGTVTALEDEGADSVLATVSAGEAQLLARITRAAVLELGLRRGSSVWALIKAASLRGRAFRTHETTGASPARPP